MVKHLLLAAILTLTAYQLEAQVPACNPPNAPPAPNCAASCIYCNFINGYAGTTIGQTPSNVPNFCGTIENDQWFGFIAGATSATFTVTPVTNSCLNGDGIQVALYAVCGGPNLGCNQGCNNCGNQAQSITVNNMVIGQNYFLLIDGYAGDQCNFTVSVSPASAVTAPQPGAPGAFTGPTTVCPGATVQYCIPVTPNVSVYNWTVPAGTTVNGINGPGPISVSSIGNPGGRCVNIHFPTTPGPIQICVTPANSCYPGTQTCMTATVVDLPTATISGSTTTCSAGAIPVTVPVTFTGAGPWTFSYKIDGGATQTVTGTTTNPYILNVNAASTVTLISVSTPSGSGNCPGTVMGTYTVNHSVVIFAGTVTNPVCNGGNTGSILITTSSGTQPFSFNWNPSQGNTSNPMNLPAGSYDVTVTDAAGCTKTATYVVSAPPPLTATVSNIVGANCSNPTGGSAIANGAGGTPGYNYEWTGGAMTQTLTGVGPGTYTVTVSDAKMCTSTATATIPGDFVNPTAVATGNGVINCTTMTVPLSGTGSSTGGNITYNWSGGPLTGPTNQINATANGAGTFTLLVTNTTNGCTATAMVTITDNLTLPTAVATANGTITCTNATLTIDGTGSSAGGNFTYNWSPTAGIVSGGTTLMPVVNAAGTYTLTVTNTTNGCTATASATVNQNTTLPVATIATPPVLNCTTTQLDLNASGSTYQNPATFAWSPAGGIVSGGTTLNPTVNQPGTYTLTITSANGCTATASVTVTQNNTLPTAVAAAPTPISCTTPNGPLNGTGSSTGAGITYLWSGPNVTGSTTTINTTAGTAGTYTILVTNTNNGCTATAMVTIGGDTNLPTAVANAPGGIDCTTMTITLNGTGSSTGGNFSYNWSPTAGIVSGGTTLNPVVNMGGTYTLTVTNTTNNCTATASATVTQNTVHPTPIINPPNILNCNNATIDLNANGSIYQPPATFAWSPTAGIVAGGTTLNPTINQPGTYTLTITQTNGCTGTASVTVTQDLIPPTAAASTSGQVSCTTPNVPLIGTGSSTGGNISYNWSGPSVSGPTNTINSTAGQPGVYTILVTNNTNGCTAAASTNVVGAIDFPLASASSPGQIDCNNSQLTLSGAGSSVGPDFNYLWTASGGGNIVSGSTTLSPVINMGGTYTLVVTNSMTGCTATDQVTVNQNTTHPTVIINFPGQLDCINTVLNLDATNSLYNPGATFNWTTTNGHFVFGQNTPNPQIDQPGTYNLLITNQDNGCTGTASITVVQNNTLPNAAAATSGMVDCNQPNAPLIGTGSSTGATINYLWTTTNGFISGPTNTINTTAGSPGLYMILVTNSANGCTATASVNVSGNTTPPDAVATTNGQIDCNTTQTSLSGAGSSLGPNFSYLWTASGGGNIVSGGTTLAPIVNHGGTYTLHVNNSTNGCTNTASVVVIEDTNHPQAIVATPADINCINAAVGLDASASNFANGTGTFSWTTLPPGHIVSGANSSTPLVDHAGNYTLQITDNVNGCTAQITVIVVENTTPPVANAGPNGNITCPQPVVNLNGSGSSSGSNISYLWTTTNGSIISPNDQIQVTVDAAGTYNLLVTNLQNGCTDEDDASVTTNVALPIADAGPDASINCLNLNLILNGTGSSAGNNFTYQWSTIGGSIVSGAMTLMPVINAPGTYFLQVTNSQNGCTQTDATVVDDNQIAPTVMVAGGGIISCTNATVMLSGAGSSTGNGFSYLWTTLDGNIQSGATTLSPVVSEAGTYTLKVTNAANGCTATASIVVDQDNSVPTATTVQPPLLDCNTTTAVLDASASSNGTGFSFVWSTTNGHFASGETTLQPTIDQPGSYVLVVTNTNSNCTATATTLVQQDITAPPADAGQPYTLTCTQLTHQIGYALPPTDTNLVFNWTTLGGHFVSGTTSTNPIIDAPGTYNLLVSNNLTACTSTATVVISQDIVNPTVEAGSGGLLTCTATTLTLGGTASSSTGPDFQYNWSTPTGSISSGATTLSPTVTAPGVYYLEILNTVNGCKSTDSTIVTQDANLPIATATAPGVLTCSVQTITLSGAGSTTGNGLSYLWTTVDGNLQSGQTTLSPIVNQPGNYVLQVTNSNNNCISTFSIFVGQNITAPLAEAGPTATINCLSPQMLLNGVGSSSGSDYTYLWTTTDGNLVSGMTTLNPIIDKPGKYVLTVSSLVNGCTASDFVDILKDVNAPTVVLAQPAVLNCKDSTVVIDANQSSKGADLLITWTEPATGAIVSGGTGYTPTVQTPGTYSLNLTNTTNGCVDQKDVTVLQNITAPPADAGSPYLLTCVDLEATLGGPNNPTGVNFTFDWTTTGGSFSTQQNISAPKTMAPGTYSLVVTDETNHCTATDDVVISQNITPPLANAGPGKELNCQVPTYTLKATASSGPTFTYDWTTVGGHFTNSTNILQPTVDAKGTYTLLVTDQSNGCTTTSEVVITQSADVPTAVAGLPTTLTCKILTATLDGTGSSVGPDFTYLWTTANGLLLSGDSTLMPTIGKPGTYVISVINKTNNCKSSSQVIVNEDVAPPTVDAGPQAVLTCSQTTTTLTGTASGSSQLTFLWTTQNGSIVSGATTKSIVVDLIGTYNFLVTNELNGCTATDSALVINDVNLPTVAIQPAATLTCAVPTVELNAQNGTSTGPTIQYTWSTTDGHFVSQNPILKPTVDKPGTYKLLVKNTSNGCTAETTVVVSQDIAPPIAVAGQTQVITCTNPILTLDGTGSSIGPNFTYLWTTANGSLLTGTTTLKPTVDKPGVYQIKVTNTTNGCTTTASVTITPDVNYPVAAIAQPSVLTCVAPLAILDASGSSSGTNFTLKWTTTGGNFTTAQTTLKPTVDEPGVYNLLITNTLNGCTSTATVTVLEDKIFPTADAGLGFEITCSVLNGPLSGTATPAQTSIVWTTVGGQILSGTTTLSPTVGEAGIYKMTVTRLDNGCTATDEVTVTEQTNKPTDLQTTVTLPRCDGNVGEIVISSVTGGIGPFLYSIDGGQSFFAESDFKNIKPGTYSLVIQDANGCEWMEILVVPAPLEPTVAFDSPQIKVELGATGELNALVDPNFPLDLIDTVIWKPTTGLTFKSNSIEDLLNPLASPLKNQVYEVTVISKAGCDATAKIKVVVGKDRHVFIPNVITPWNHDGDNDELIIFADPAQVVEITAFEMFDRWGDKVFAAYGFQPNSPADGWPAVVRAQKLNPGVFVYWAKIKFIDEKVVLYKGDVTIVR